MGMKASVPMKLSTTPALRRCMSTSKDGTVLYRRIISLGMANTKEEKEEKSKQVYQLLDDWEKECHTLYRTQILSFATELRRSKHPFLALQLYEWMDKKKKTMNNADRAIRIDLLSKTKGIESAEKYFESLVETAKTIKTYGALLNCYCHWEMVDEATRLFAKMKELNLHNGALHYNNLMNLYMKVGQPEKVPLVFREMEEENVVPDLYSYNQLMNAYAALNDIDGVERVMEMMKSKEVKYDWFTFGNVATIYVNAGLVDKANTALEELEKRKMSKDREACHTLIKLYSCTSNADGVNRAWEVCKSKFPKLSNTSYLIMHLALSKLGDFDGLEKLFREWESVCSIYDIRIPNVLLESFLKRDMTEEASLLYDSVIRRGVQPNLRTHDSFIHLCLKKPDIGLALESLEVGASKLGSVKNNWFPSKGSVNAFLKYFKEEKDTDGAAKFREMMKKINRLDEESAKALDEVCPS